MGRSRAFDVGLVAKLLFVAALIFAGLQLAGLGVGASDVKMAQGRPVPVRPKPATAQAEAAPMTPVPAPPVASDGFVVRRVLNIAGPFRHGDYVWDDAGIPAGPILVTIDLAAETLSVFRGGYEIGAAVILFGADSKPTPLGTYPILQKDKDHVSNLYDAPMPYMLRLTNDGVSIHASEVAWDAATHGCIGVPKPFAQKLFAQVKVGDRVVITRGKMMAVGAADAGA